MKKTLILAGAAALLLAGCGRMADLEAPQARQNERAPRDANAKSPTEPATINRSPSRLPIDSGASDPFGKPPMA
ncbi:LPS translocon maturation chaperone LptM [Brevundimonas faecalis]|uniref:PBP1b-binding outer membrane lipoprotein LpoB n=1 Tax=Brevundimonas faecalis TaxID=947378 RepID=A0ABV2RB83_9CAUL